MADIDAGKHVLDLGFQPAANRLIEQRFVDRSAEGDYRTDATRGFLDEVRAFRVRALTAKVLKPSPG